LRTLANVGHIRVDGWMAEIGYCRMRPMLFYPE